MLNFTIHTTTEVVFGRNIEEQIGPKLKEIGAHRVLVHFGGSSARSSGLLDRVEKSLFDAGLSFIELGGVSPNPKVGMVRKGIALCKREGIDFILAIGGGSVIDSAKGIGMGVATGRDPWEFAATGEAPADTLPIATVLTLAASGSETSNSCVLTNEETKEKRGITSQTNRPRISFLNPENMFSVSKFQTGCGIVAWALYQMERQIPGFAPLATRVLGVEMDFAHPERTAREGILTLKRFFEEINMPVHMAQLGIKPSDYEKLADNTVRTVGGPVKSYSPLDKDAILAIYRLAE